MPSPERVLKRSPLPSLLLLASASATASPFAPTEVLVRDQRGDPVGGAAVTVEFACSRPNPVDSASWTEAGAWEGETDSSGRLVIKERPPHPLGLSPERLLSRCRKSVRARREGFFGVSPHDRRLAETIDRCLEGGRTPPRGMTACAAGAQTRADAPRIELELRPLPDCSRLPRDPSPGSPKEESYAAAALATCLPRWPLERRAAALPLALRLLGDPPAGYRQPPAQRESTINDAVLALGMTCRPEAVPALVRWTRWAMGDMEAGWSPYLLAERAGGALVIIGTPEAIEADRERDRAYWAHQAVKYPHLSPVALREHLSAPIDETRPARLAERRRELCGGTRRPRR